MIQTIEFDLEAFKVEVNNLCEKGIGLLDSILTICEKNGIDIETISPLIKKDPELKSRVFVEAEKLNYIKKTRLE